MTTSFAYHPHETEAEKASNSYLMSLVAVVAGLPLPILNVIATFIYFMANRKAPFFARWHCTQALISQIALMPFNSVLFWWTIDLILAERELSNEYFAYLITILVFNIAEFVSTVYCAIQTRKGHHVELWFFGGITNLICRR